ncbi:MAG: DUF4430 domain-containing protein [Candidatus Pacebacteria bacterium]|nr:DUF4430 domain-containing protein [Candidatus Paceibacterota bacterium]
MKNKKIKIIIVVIIVLILLGLFFFIPHGAPKQQTTNLPAISENLNLNTTANKPVSQTKTIETVLEINGVSYEDAITQKMSVYDFMSQLRSEGKINFTEQNYMSMGKFINEINGIKNSNSLVWIYYVNGIEAQIGISNYKINPGDVVSWKYEKSDY